MPLIANLLVVVYALDGCLSLLETVLRAATGSLALLGLRNAFATVVFGTGILYLPLLVLTPRLPTVTLLLLILSLVWLNFSAAPLPILIDSTVALSFASVLFQFSFALLIFYQLMRFIHHHQEGSWRDEFEVDPSRVDAAVRLGLLWDVTSYLVPFGEKRVGQDEAIS